MNKFLCCAQIVGLKLPVKTTYYFSNYCITNDIDLIWSEYINREIFANAFGVLALNHFNKYHFILTVVDLPNPAHVNYYESLINTFISQLWRIRDNSIFLHNIYYIGIDNPDVDRSKLMFNHYLSNGSMNPTEFDIKDIDNTVNLLGEFSGFLIEKDITNLSLENTESVQVSDLKQLFEHNDLKRIERSLMFINQARQTNDLPMKITNYCAFLECLFSTTNTEISHQIAERCAFFLEKYLNLEKLEIYDKIKSAYDIRSKYIHGDSLSSKYNTKEKLIPISEYMDQICRNVLNSILKNNLKIFNSHENKVKTNYFKELIFNEKIKN